MLVLSFNILDENIKELAFPFKRYTVARE